MADREDKLVEEIAQIKKLAKEDKKIDTTALVTDAITRHRASTTSPRNVGRAYVVSLLFPPFGLYYVAKFFLQDDEEARHVAWVCLVLTVAASFFTLWLLQSAFSTPSVHQIQNISPQDIRSLTQ